MLNEIFKKSIFKIQDKSFSFKTERVDPSAWIEKNVYLTSAESRYSGLFSFDRSPYTREIADCFSPNSNVQIFAVKKCSQSGFTAMLTALIAYIISESPSNIMFLSGSETLVQDTMRDRLDPVLQNSGIKLAPNVIKKKNQKSGDTDFKKEFSGGSLTASAYNPRHLRFYSVKYILADEYDDASLNNKKEGSIRSLIEARTKSYGSSKKIAYISSPTIKGQSNIEEVYDRGDKRKWNWKCPGCNDYIPIEWRIKKDDGTFAGIKYELNDNNELIEESVHYECQNCSHKITYDLKYELNLSGRWIPTSKPLKPRYRSYELNALVIPPGFDTWVDLVYEWLAANPKDKPVDEGKLKAFVNTQLGQTWEEKGVTPRVTDLMNNVRSYEIGLVPDKTCENDGNGKIVLISMACDLGGIMNEDVQDVRLDYEIIAHTSSGVTYSIQHGSIGTFKRARQKSKIDVEKESLRKPWTYLRGQNLCVWDELEKIIKKPFIGQSEKIYEIDITIIDTGHFTKLAYDFVKSIKTHLVIGIKGYSEDDYRRLTKDTPIIKNSLELSGKLYLLQVNQIKDILASNMKLKMGMDGYQPTGFMNYPQPSLGKYNLKSYFSHFESEHRIPVIKNDVEVGYSWKKKNSDVENHFFDCAVYNIAAKEIFIHQLRMSHPQNAKLTWEDFVKIFENKL